MRAERFALVQGILFFHSNFHNYFEFSWLSPQCRHKFYSNIRSEVHYFFSWECQEHVTPITCLHQRFFLCFRFSTVGLKRYGIQKEAILDQTESFRKKPATSCRKSNNNSTEVPQSKCTSPPWKVIIRTHSIYYPQNIHFSFPFFFPGNFFRADNIGKN